MKKQLAILEKFVANDSALNEKVSSQSVNWHIQHSLIVILVIIAQLEKSDKSTYKWKFSLPKLYIFAIGKLPRGKGRAPKQVIPETILSQAELIQMIEKTNVALARAGELSSHVHFPHPYFGSLKKKKTLYFLEIHTDHHIKIIEDILKMN